MPVKAILFDKDGTLISYHKSWMPLNHKACLHVAGGDQESAFKLLEKSGWIPASGKVRPNSLLAAGTPEEITDCWIQHLPSRVKSRDILIEEVKQIFLNEAAAYATAVTNLKDLFKRLRKKGFRLGVATSDSQAGARASLAPFDIFDLLDFLCGYDSGYGIKPNPGMVKGFCNAIDLPPDEIAVVGDNLHDLHMARAAGSCAIGVLTGTSSRQDLAPQADYILDNIEGLTEIFT